MRIKAKYRVNKVRGGGKRERMDIPKDQQSCRTAIFRCYRIPYVGVTEGYRDSRSDLSFVDKLYSIAIKLVNG